MKDLRIDGRLQRVFVLQETESRVVYIPLKALNRVDYDRLVDIEKRGGDMLKEMSRTTLDNGRNALDLYDEIIQIADLGTNIERIRKPEETIITQQAPQSEPRPKQEPKEEEKPAAPKKRGRGRPPKNPKPETAE